MSLSQDFFDNTSIVQHTRWYGYIEFFDSIALTHLQVD
jgi:hypothetical protein